MMKKFTKKCTAFALMVVLTVTSIVTAYGAVHPMLEEAGTPDIPFEVRYVVELYVMVSGMHRSYALFSNEPISVTSELASGWGYTVFLHSR